MLPSPEPGPVEEWFSPPPPPEPPDEPELPLPVPLLPDEEGGMFEGGECPPPACARTVSMNA